MKGGAEEEGGGRGQTAMTVCACVFITNVCVGVGEVGGGEADCGSYSLLLTHNKGGSEVERTGMSHSASPPKYPRVSAGWHPPTPDGAPVWLKPGQRRPFFFLIPPPISPRGLECAAGSILTPSGQIRSTLSRRLSRQENVFIYSVRAGVDMGVKVLKNNNTYFLFISYRP